MSVHEEDVDTVNKFVIEQFFADVLSYHSCSVPVLRTFNDVRPVAWVRQGESWKVYGFSEPQYL